MKWQIRKDPDNRKTWVMLLGEGKDATYVTYEGSQKDAYKKFHAVLKKDYGVDVDFNEHKTMIPVKHEDKDTGEVKRHFVPKLDYSLTEKEKPEPKSKMHGMLIKKDKITGDYHP